MESAASAYAITMARELRQMSQAALCKEVGISQGTLSKVENEQIPASEELVEKVASGLGLPKSFFYQSLEFKNLPQTFFRKYDIGQTKTKSIRAKVHMLRLQLGALLNAVETPEDRVPRVRLDEYPGSIENLAAEVRVHWQVRPGPLGNLTSLVERMGVVVLECDFGTAKVDAVSLREADLPPFVLMNPSMPGDRWRFTLAHELGHLIMHHGRFLGTSTADIESEAHRFASAFLMPGKDISGQFIGRLTLDRLASMKSVWKVSMQALIMRASSLRRITESQKRRLFMQMGKLGYRRDEPVFVEREQPGFVKGLIRFHLEELGYSVEQLSGVLNILESEVYDLYPQALRRPLRLVE